ncbi:MAG: TatD family hydrolase [Sphaerochaetaceae bacterium]
MTRYIDSHFHLVHLKEKGYDIQQLLAQLEASQWAGGIDIGSQAFDLVERKKLLKAYPLIRLAAGIGPWGAQGQDSIAPLIAQFTEMVYTHRPDAIGEIGLDWYWKYGTLERQSALFTAQIDLACQLDVPIIIHSREADEPMQQILATSKISVPVIMHCWASGWSLLKTAIEKGYSISFAGPITYKNNVQLRQMLQSVPLKQLLLETDSPYLSPQAQRGKLNTPLNIVYVYEKAAEIHRMEPSELAIVIQENFERLFGKNGQ